MRFGTTPESDRKVTWYFTAPGAKLLPYPTAFGSRNWASEKTGWTYPGEVEGASRTWSNGARRPEFIGQSPCGAAVHWQEGFGAGNPADLPANEDDVPFCCLGQFVPRGGILGGGIAQQLGPALGELGGAELGGFATWGGTTGQMGMGGAELGGAANFSPAGLFEGEGGAELGGEAGTIIG